MKDILGRTFKVGDIIVYPDMQYTDVKIGIITKITPKTFRYGYFCQNWRNKDCFEITTANVPRRATIINNIVSDDIKEKLQTAIKE